MQKHQLYMQRCLDLALNGSGTTSPNPMVGCVIVHNDNIITQGWHHKAGEAHAEVNAIRKATKLLGRFDLSDCEIYSSCEPCPMCFTAIHWAKMKSLYVGANRYDAAAIGFDDQYIYDVINKTAKVQQVHIEYIDNEGGDTRGKSSGIEFFEVV